MNTEYLLEKLLMWAEIFYGKDAKVFSKKKKGLYLFGTKKNINVLSKPLAIFLCIGELPSFKPKNNKKNDSHKKRSGRRNKKTS